MIDVDDTTFDNNDNSYCFTHDCAYEEYGKYNYDNYDDYYKDNDDDVDNAHDDD